MGIMDGGNTPHNDWREAQLRDIAAREKENKMPPTPETPSRKRIRIPMTTKAVVMALLFFLALLLFVWVFFIQVKPGYVGVRVNKFGADRGVESVPLTNGVYYNGWPYEVHPYPTFQQNVQWSRSTVEGKPVDDSFTFQCEGMDVSVDIGMAFLIEPGKAPLLFQTFRLGMDEITDVYLKQQVRDALNGEASKRVIEQIYSSGATEDGSTEDVTADVLDPKKAKAKKRRNVDYTLGGRNEFVQAVKALVTTRAATIGIGVKDFTMGSPRLPSTVTNAINAKITATQDAVKVENELRSTIATAAKEKQKAIGNAAAITEVAEAQARANNKIAASITPALIEYKRIEKWDGALPTVQGGNTPFVNIPAK